MNNRNPIFQEVWNRIRTHEGEEFKTITGKPFTYQIHGDVFNPSRTNYNVTKSDFEKAFVLTPFKGPGMVNLLVRGPSYIWAVLHDSRVRKDDW